VSKIIYIWKEKVRKGCNNQERPVNEVEVEFEQGPEGYIGSEMFQIWDFFFRFWNIYIYIMRCLIGGVQL
jgi:hypothetical protein